MRRERDSWGFHAEMFRGDRVERKGGRAGIGAILSPEGAWEQDWAVEIRWSASRWSLGEINRSREDGKSRAQEARHVRQPLMHGIDRLRPLTGSTTDSGVRRLTHQSLGSRLFLGWLQAWPSGLLRTLVGGGSVRGGFGDRSCTWGREKPAVGTHGRLLNAAS